MDFEHDDLQKESLFSGSNDLISADSLLGDVAHDLYSFSGPIFLLDFHTIQSACILMFVHFNRFEIRDALADVMIAIYTILP